MDVRVRHALVCSYAHTQLGGIPHRSTVQACGGYTTVSCYDSVGVGMAVLDAGLVVLLCLTGAVLLERRKVKDAPAARAAAPAAAAAAPASGGKPKSFAESLFGGGGGGAAGESV